MVLEIPLNSPGRAELGNKQDLSQDRRVGDKDERGFDKEGRIRTQDKSKSGRDFMRSGVRWRKCLRDESRRLSLEQNRGSVPREAGMESKR
jgi:hypothetical protein